MAKKKTTKKEEIKQDVKIETNEAVQEAAPENTETGEVDAVVAGEDCGSEVQTDGAQVDAVTEIVVMSRRVLTNDPIYQELKAKAEKDGKDFRVAAIGNVGKYLDKGYKVAKYKGKEVVRTDSNKIDGVVTMVAMIK